MAVASASSSPSSSRSSSLDRNTLSTTSRTSSDAVGTASDDYYSQVLSPWRAGARKFIMQTLPAESAWIARTQKRLRSSRLDNYFLYSSALGAHTCFLLVLPALYFFGYPQTARAYVLASSSDLGCFRHHSLIFSLFQSHYNHWFWRVHNVFHKRLYLLPETLLPSCGTLEYVFAADLGIRLPLLTNLC